MKIGFVVASLLAVAVQSLRETDSVFARHAYHIEEFGVTKLSERPAHLPNAMERLVSIHITTKDHIFDLELALNEFIFAKDSKIYSSRKDEFGNPIEIEKEYRSYHGNATIRSRGLGIVTDKTEPVISEIACVTFYPDNRAHVLVITPDDIFTIDRIEIHQESKEIAFSGEDKKLGMSMTRLSDRGESNITPFHKTVMEASQRKRLTDRRKLIIYFDNCWPGQSSFYRIASIGVIVDNKYYCQILTNSDTASCQVGGQDSKVLADIQSLINAASAVYAAQFKVYLQLGTTYLGSSAASLSPNDASCPDMSTQLNVLKAWRATYYNQHTSTDSNTVFHMFTNCHPPPGMVGLAYIGVLCNAGSGYGTGVVNRVYDQTWLTFAHEGGHNFGMSHSFQNGQGTTGGIMDYGNGLYQGEYQFEPAKKPEVCQQLTSALSTTYSGFLPVDRCLPQYNQQPVPAPTLQPSTTKAPTKKPASPTTSSKPTYAPTPVQYYARWYKTGTYNYCYPSCGDYSYATEILKCCASDLSSSNVCNWEIDASYCDPATKPTPNSLKCNVSPCSNPATLCGNGVLDKGEYCDPSVDNCCLYDCSGFFVTDDCVRKNTRVDAAFTDRNGRVYIFQGPYYTRFTDFYQWYYNHAESGYPKTIKGNFPLQQCTQNIGAVVARESNQLFVFCGSLTYVKVDLDNQLQLAGVYNAATDWNLPQEFVSCGQVTAALGLTYDMRLFCQNIWISIPYARTRTSTDTIPIHSVTEYGFTLQDGYIITAIMYDRISGYWAWFQGNKNYVSMQGYEIASSPRQTVSIFNDTTANISSLEGQGGCYQDSCSQCLSGVCKQCAAGYLLYGSRCFNDSVLAYLQCDEGSQSDANLVDGGLATLVGFNYTTGVSGTALVFDGQTKLQMRPLKRNITDFSISAYFKPKSLNQATFVNIDNKFNFSYESVDNSSFQVMIQITNYKFTCYVATPMKLHEWNKIQVIINDSIIWTGANGFFHMRAFDSDQQGLNLQLNFDSWSIGADYNGIDGYLDEFIVIAARENVDTSTDNGSSNKLEVWQIALIASAGLLVIGVAAFFIYKCVHRQKLREQVSDNYYLNFK